MAGDERDVVPIYLHLPPREIAYVKFVFESYEGVAVVRTLDRHTATLVVLAAPDFEAEARAVIAGLSAEGACEEIAEPPGYDGDPLGDPRPLSRVGSESEREAFGSPREGRAAAGEAGAADVRGKVR
jgi:Domain of unknown function (DUF4911)